MTLTAVSFDGSRRSHCAIVRSPLVAVRSLPSRDRRLAAGARDLARRG